MTITKSCQSLCDLPGGDHTCLVTRRNQVAELIPAAGDAAQLLIELAAHIPAAEGASGGAHTFPVYAASD
jgi:hypothetical protein